MRASAMVLSNNILVRAHKEKKPVTPMKLQKLLYYVCVKYAKETGTSPINEEFSVWKYGPVIPSVYAEFRAFGALPIKGYSRDAKKKAYMVDESANPVLRGCIDYIWGRFKDYSGIDLSRLTHKENSGWYSAFQKYQETISLEEMKNDTTI